MTKDIVLLILKNTEWSLLIMNKHILKHKHLLLLTASLFILGACGVNSKKVTADINSNIQSGNIESATEIYSTSIEKLKNNPSALSEFEDVLVTSLTENMETKYKEVLKDYSKVNEFNVYLDNIKKLNIKNSKLTDSWISYDSKVEDVVTKEFHQDLTGIWETEDQQIIYLFKEDSYSSILMGGVVTGVTSFLDYLSPYAPYTIEGIDAENLSLDILKNDEIFNKKQAETYIFSPDRQTVIRKVGTGEKTLRYLGEIDELSAIMEPRLGFFFPENMPTVHREAWEFLNNDEVWGDIGYTEFHPKTQLTYFVTDPTIVSIIQYIESGTIISSDTGEYLNPQDAWQMMLSELLLALKPYQARDNTVGLTIYYRNPEKSNQDELLAIIGNGQVNDFLSK